MEENSPLFTILQVSQRLNIPKHTLRFWERELNGILVPQRTPGGQRRYTLQNIKVLETIKNLRDSGLSLPRIIERIGATEDFNSDDASQIDLLANRVAEAVKKEVYNFFKHEKNEV